MSDGMTAPPNKQLVRAYVGANGESHQGVTGVTSGKLREAEQKLDEPAIKPEAIEQHEPAVLPLSTVDSAGTVPEPSDIVEALDFVRAPYPEARSFINGRWLEAGEIDPGSDGTELLAELVSKGRIIDRKFTDKVKTAAKKVLSTGTGKASK